MNRSDLDKVRCDNCTRPITQRNLPRHLTRCDGTPPLSVEERLWANVQRGDGCWEWTGTIQSEGYGTFYRDGKNVRAHRVVYEAVVGHVPAGHVLDHACHNEAAARGECSGTETCAHRRCVNPDHIEAVTDAENIARGRLGFAARTLCRAGLHDITDPSSWHIGSNGRQCGECYRSRRKKRPTRPTVEQGDETRLLEHESENT